MVAGQISSKLAKISGSPSLQVQTDSVVMGVRGTEFSIASSVNGSILVVCTEGAVACSDLAGYAKQDDRGDCCIAACDIRSSPFICVDRAFNFAVDPICRLV